MRKNGKILYCKVCGRGRYIPKYRWDSFRCCSRECNDKWKLLLVIKRYSWTRSLLKKLYLDEGLSLRNICRATGANPENIKSLRRVFKRYGIELRHGGDAIKVQWINNNERRKRASKFAKKNLAPRSGEGWQQKYPERAKKVYKRFSIERMREGNPNWKGGQSEYGVEWKEVNPLVLKRDKYLCQICGGKKDLQVHHIIPFVESFDNSLDNLVTVCQKCHYNNRLHNKDVYEKLKDYENFKKAFQREGI